MIVPPRTWWELCAAQAANTDVTIFKSDNPTADTPLCLAGMATGYQNNNARIFIDGGAGPNTMSCAHGGVWVGRTTKDFCGEFQTSGITGCIDEGGFGYGLGNGQRGGFIFVRNKGGKQYEKMADHTSIQRLDKALEPLGHMVVRHYIEEHYNETRSRHSKEILDNWKDVKDECIVSVPKVLAQQIKPEEIANYMAMCDESFAKRITAMPFGERQLLKAHLGLMRYNALAKNGAEAEMQRAVSV